MKIFSSSPLWQSSGLAVIRITVGILMTYHGVEVFDSEKMKMYFGWDMFKKSSFTYFLPYVGKVAELIAGILMTIGFFTRLSSLVIAATMLYVSFVIGNGKIWYEDQHPFLFVLLALVFFFAGPCRWSIDQLINAKQQKVK